LHALGDAIGAFAVLNDLVEIPGQHLDCLIDLASRVGSSVAMPGADT
jgi:hypothetical protein